MKSLYSVYMKKKVTTRQSTKKFPCIRYRPKTCHDIQMRTMTEDKFKCRIPYLSFGPHFTDNTDLPECKTENITEMLPLYKTLDQSCNVSLSCLSQTFTITTRVHNKYNKLHMIDIQYDIPEVERHHTYVSYDLLSLIAETGGILGLTLGISGLSLSKETISLLKNFRKKFA